MTKPELQGSTAKPYCLQAIERHGAITKLTMTLSPDLVYLRFSHPIIEYAPGTTADLLGIYLATRREAGCLGRILTDHLRWHAAKLNR